MSPLYAPYLLNTIIKNKVGRLDIAGGQGDFSEI